MAPTNIVRGEHEEAGGRWRRADWNSVRQWPDQVLSHVRRGDWEGRGLCADDVQAMQACLLLVLLGQFGCESIKLSFNWLKLNPIFFQDDFLLRHYDKGPCKNKLGHSRASVVWHRAQVIGIFAGFGILLLVASPLLLLAAPCIVCCKCRICSGGPKMEEPMDFDPEFDPLSLLQAPTERR